MVYKNLTKKILDMGGIIEPIYIDNKDSSGTGLCNASLLYNDNILQDYKQVIDLYKNKHWIKI